MELRISSVTMKVVIAERLSARHPNSAARSRLAMFVCMSVTLQEFNYSHA